MSCTFDAIRSFKVSRLEQNSPQVIPSFNLTYSCGLLSGVGSVDLVVGGFVASEVVVGSVIFIGGLVLEGPDVDVGIPVVVFTFVVDDKLDGGGVGDVGLGHTQ